MATTNRSRSSAASQAASPRSAAGTKIMLTSVPVFPHGRLGVVEDSHPQAFCPSFPGNPGHHLGAYSIIFSVWNMPSLPVRPLHHDRVSPCTKRLMPLLVLPAPPGRLARFMWEISVYAMADQPASTGGGGEPIGGWGSGRQAI